MVFVESKYSTLSIILIAFFCKRQSVSVDKPKDPKGFHFNRRNMDYGIAEANYKPTPGENLRVWYQEEQKKNHWTGALCARDHNQRAEHAVGSGEH